MYVSFAQLWCTLTSSIMLFVVIDNPLKEITFGANWFLPWWLCKRGQSMWDWKL